MDAFRRRLVRVTLAAAVAAGTAVALAAAGLSRPAALGAAAGAWLAFSLASFRR